MQIFTEQVFRLSLTAVGAITGLAALATSWLTYRLRRDAAVPRLIVRPMVRHMFEEGSGETSENVILFEIRNVGQITVVLEKIGFSPKPFRKTGAWVPKPIAYSNTKLHDELEPQHVAVFGVNLDGLPDAMLPPEKGLGRATVITRVGDQFRSSRRATKQFKRELRAMTKKPA